MIKHILLKISAAFWLSIFIFIFLLSSCSNNPSKPSSNEFAENFTVVVAGPDDTLEALAKQYLGSKTMGEVIAEFNQIDSIAPGQALIIPKQPLYPGGLLSKGYQTVPILVYHRIEEGNPSKMVVIKKRFREQMQYLKKHDYQPISLDQLLNFTEFKQAIPKKSVVITFDDGWYSLYKNAYPILKEFDFPATLFVYTDLIKGSKNALSWKQIQEMSENGINIQCHTQTHRDLTQFKNNEKFNDYFKNIQADIQNACNLITKKTGKPVQYLAYPYGATNNLVAALLEKRAYRAAFTVKRGGNPGFISPYHINRSMIYGNYDLKQFKKNLNLVKIR